MTNKKRILFVDDETNIIDGLKRMLRKQQGEWDMSFSSNGEEALAIAQEQPLDVVITDIRMPGMGGDELLEHFVRLWPETARIVLSGHADESTTHRVLNVAHQFLSKPTSADQLQQAVSRACSLQDIIRNKRIREVVAQCDTLPSLPSLYVELQEAAESDTANAQAIGAILSHDIGMSAKILQLVNSSFFGIGRRVSSIEQAVTLLGIVRIKALVLSESVFRQFVPPPGLTDLAMEKLLDRSYLVAELSRQITRVERQSEDRPDQAFMAGLLRDAGILVLVSQQTEAFVGAVREARATGRPLWEVEAERLNVTHAEIGTYILGLWGLPPRIVEAVAYHHTPAEVNYDGLCATTAVHVADALISELHASADNDPLGAQLDNEYLERIGLQHRLDHWRELAVRTCEITQVGT